MSCNVILYGAGEFGLQVGLMLKEYDEFHILCYLDKNMGLAQEIINDVQVLTPDCIVGMKYDFVLLCSKSGYVVEEMKKELLMRNVDEKKIVAECFFRSLQIYLKKADRVRFERDCIYLIFQHGNIDSGIECGEFSWYVPQIHGSPECANIKMGKFCNIARDVIFFRGGETNWRCGALYDFRNIFEEYEDTPWRERSKGDIVVGNNVLLYSGVKVLSGVSIGDGAVVAANSLVGTDIPPYAIAWGVPAKVFMYRFDSPTIEKLEEMQWWDWKYEQIYDAVPLLQSEDIDALYRYYICHVKE